SGVWLDALSARLLERQFELQPQPDGVLLLHETLEEDEARRLLGKAIPCLGRDSELGTLEAQLHACIDESMGRGVLITAPRGMGKSRLRLEFLRRLRSGDKNSGDKNVTAIEGRGDMMSAGSPYAILVKALRRLCGVGGGEPTPVQQARLHERLSRHLPAESV